LYPIGVIKDCLVEFEEFGEFEVGREDDYVVVQIANPDPDFADVLHHEIGNFILAATIEHKRST
jgi:hypothetical protein